MNYMPNILQQKPETGPPAEPVQKTDTALALSAFTMPSKVKTLTEEDLHLIAQYFDYPEFVPMALEGDTESLRYVAVELATLAREASTDENARKLLDRLAQLGLTDTTRHPENF
ncbi:MAG: hypothetical protein DI585_05435 [Pseudomonas fluorescens]|nr:MAG: hypothetical protein DI585_05435 [Pseudomonas fluorescens]